MSMANKQLFRDFLAENHSFIAREFIFVSSVITQHKLSLIFSAPVSSLIPFLLPPPPPAPVPHSLAELKTSHPSNHKKMIK